ncbi:MAG: DUF3754 domain-containing protein [Myxococcota bacterium]|nr:DUF3754 domain-containing protein [Myxococcota bacterium]
MHYIPISRAKIRATVLEELITDVQMRETVEQVANLLEAIWHHRSHGDFEALKKLYTALDPDSNETTNGEGASQFLTTFEKMLTDGNWEQISDEELQAALDGEDVFPISLDVRFDELVTNRLFKLGEAAHEQTKTSLFGLKKTTSTVDVYDRVIQALQFQDRAWFEANNRVKHYPGDAAKGLHLRLFKTVPKLDLETIYPNTTPNMRTIDKMKIAAPLVGGLVTLGIKFGPLLFGKAEGSGSLAVVGGIVSALGTYMLKSYLSYRKTREQYLAQVSKDLYFKGQANNSAVMNVVTDLSEEQEVKEALLAYCFLLSESAENYDEARLDARIEAWLSERFQVEVDFEVDDALGKLRDLELLMTGDAGVLNVVPAAHALERLKKYWQGLHG